MKGAGEACRARAGASATKMGNVFVFEGEGLVCERLYFDLATILRQVGIARDPTRPLGRAMTFANSPRERRPSAASRVDASLDDRPRKFLCDARRIPVSRPREELSAHAFLPSRPDLVRPDPGLRSRRRLRVQLVDDGCIVVQRQLEQRHLVELDRDGHGGHHGHTRRGGCPVVLDARSDRHGHGYTDTKVTWSVSGGGTVDQTGKYSAPITALADPVSVTATSDADPDEERVEPAPRRDRFSQGDLQARRELRQPPFFITTVVASGAMVYAALVHVDKSDPNGDQYALEVTVSKDGGATFGAPAGVADVPNPKVTLFCPSLAVDAGDANTVYLSYMIASGPYLKTSDVADTSAGMSVAVAVSHDAGVTWQNIMLESQASGFGECPDVASPKAGAVVVEAPSFDFPSPPMRTYATRTVGRISPRWRSAISRFVSPERHDLDEPFAELWIRRRIGWIRVSPPVRRRDGPRLRDVRRRRLCRGAHRRAVLGRRRQDVWRQGGRRGGANAQTRLHHPIGVFDGKEVTVAYWVLDPATGGGLRIAKSKDGGKTFTVPHAVPRYEIPNNTLSNDAMYPAIGWEGGTLWMAYLVADGSGPNRLIVDKSCDGGDTWSGSLLVNGVEPNITDSRNWPALALAGGKMHVASQVLDGNVDNSAYDLIRLVP